MSTAPFGFTDPRYAEFPPVVQIALVSGVCPSRCRHCPMGRKNAGELPADLAAELRPGFFDFGLLRKVVHEMAQYPWAILRLHSRGEPMAHPRYADMLGYAKANGVGTLTSFTNGIYLDQHRDAVLEAPLDMIEISADAPDAETYRAWRRTDNFGRIHAAVTDLHRARQECPDSPTRIVVSAVDHPDFRPHREAFLDCWRPVADKVIVRPYHTYAGRLEDPYACERGRGDYVPCVQLWERFSINTWGQVNACYNDWGDAELVGDLHEPGSTIKTVWRSAAFEAIREATLKGPHLKCCQTCSGPSLSSWGSGGYQHWVRELLEAPPHGVGEPS